MEPVKPDDLLYIDAITFYENTIKRYIITAIDQISKMAFAYCYSNLSSKNTPVLDKYFPMICWCGIFANKWGKQYLALVGSALGQSFIIGSEKQSTPRWAERRLN